MVWAHQSEYQQKCEYCLFMSLGSSPLSRKAKKTDTHQHLLEKLLTPPLWFSESSTSLKFCSTFTFFLFVQYFFLSRSTLKAMMLKSISSYDSSTPKPRCSFNCIASNCCQISVNVLESLELDFSLFIRQLDIQPT